MLSLNFLFGRLFSHAFLNAFGHLGAPARVVTPAFFMMPAASRFSLSLRRI
jgi:hypothetical protein